MNAKRKLQWIRVTNEYVATFGQKGCTNCEGAGIVGEEPRFTICSCAALAFRREMVETGKVRQRRQRMKDANGVVREVTWQEYRPMGTVE